MKTDIILAGVGGQGILTIAASIGYAALHDNLNLKQSEVHGMSQRGGAVQSHMRLSSNPIASDLIPLGSADVILSVEPMESLRYLPYLSKNGWIITNSLPFINIPNYPEYQKILDEINKIPNHVLIDADKIAEEAGSVKSSNIVMLGAASPYIEMSYESFIEGIKKLFGRKSEEMVNLNIKAFDLGRKISMEKKK
ncbi:MAG TPA: indolepyruvate oxidoreductase subunit beta [Bacteroidales bacterium]|nr:indolepyruvate oxidoreductase subunit beta [Bacteroidales bacterium]